MIEQAWREASAGATRFIELGRARRWLLPFTTSLLATMFVANAISGSLTHSIAGHSLLNDVGYGLDPLRAGRFDTLITNIPFALYPWTVSYTHLTLPTSDLV